MPHSVDHVPQDLGRRERRKLELRNRILEASIALFRDRGVSDTTVNDISERADVAQNRFFETLADNADEAGPMQRELLTEIVHIAHQSGTEPEQARQLQAAFGAIVERGLASGDIVAGHSSETLTETLMGTFYVLMFNWANLDGYSFRDHAMAMAHFLADSMTTDPAGSRADAGSNEGGFVA